MSSNIVNSSRINQLKSVHYVSGNIVYWMSRDQRVENNWALLRAQELSEKYDKSFEVIYCLRDNLLKSRGTARMLDFMIEGLKEVEEELSSKNIKFTFLIGNPEIKIPEYILNNNVGYLVTDYSPLRINKYWYKSIKDKIEINFEVIDAHNIIPVWEASDKQEYAAVFFRKKVNKKLNLFLDNFAKVKKQNGDIENKTDWQKIRKSIKVDESIKLPKSIISGSKYSQKIFQNFLNNKLNNYSDFRNDPNKNVLSGISPYLHFGQISAQQIALDITRSDKNKADKEAFLEELIVRRELADNFVHYNEDYDNWNGVPEWAKNTLDKHKIDNRDFVYSFEEFENAKTHDDLWNAAQIQMIKEGKMHGYMRMYWAKKILEWTKNPKTAIDFANKLNDLYEIDGREPNGYVGVLWSIGGLHDRPWFERDVYGTVRYMNANGASKKFNTQEYINKYNR